MPTRRRILPIKMRARSKKNMRPRRRKNVPEPVKAAPISKRVLALGWEKGLRGESLDTLGARGWRARTLGITHPHGCGCLRVSNTRIGWRGLRDEELIFVGP